MRAPDGIQTHFAFLISLNVTAWSSYESHALVLIWLSDCVMLLRVTRACPDLTIWLRDAVMSHTCFSWSELSDCMMLLRVTRVCPDLYLSVWCCYESHVLVLIWLSDCVMQLWDKRACSDWTISLRDAVLVKDPQFTLASITLWLLLLFQILQVVQCLTHCSWEILPVNILCLTAISLQEFYLKSRPQFSMVYTLIHHRYDVIKCSKLKWNHEAQTGGFTARFWTFYGIISMGY